MFDFFKAWQGLRIPLILLAGTLILGTLGFKVLYPEHSILHLLYMASITLSTVGYGDILNIHENKWALIYTIVLMFGGMGVVLYSTSIVTAYIIEGNLRDAFSLEKIKRRIKRMNNHFIVCGAGETGSHVVREMTALGKDCVVIEHDPLKKDEILQEFPELTILVGDATSDLMLEKAGISRAYGLVASLSNDKDNLFLTISAKMLQPKITIVSKAVELTMIKKLKRAGASRVVSPNYIGGMRMALEILKPHATKFLDNVSEQIQEQEIPVHSEVIGMRLKEVDFYQDCGINILGLGDSTHSYDINLGPDTLLQSGHVLIFMGSEEAAEKVRQKVE